MKKWQQFEQECFDFLHKKCFHTNILLELKGNYDSTCSDILVNNDKYIEIKMPRSHCGQFSVVPDINCKTFYQSKLNTNQTSKQLEISQYIIDFVSKDYPFDNPPKQYGVVPVNQDILFQWIEEHYHNKNVNWIITGKNNHYCLLDFKDIKQYFDISLELRKKRSGSSKFNKKHIEHLKQILTKNQIKFHINDDLTVILENIYDDDVFKLDNLIFRKLDDKKTYKIRILSSIENHTFVFHLKTKKDILFSQNIDITKLTKLTTLL